MSHEARQRYWAEREANADRPLFHLPICTRVPSKWRFVDLETGTVWRYDAGRTTGLQFVPVDAEELVHDLCRLVAELDADRRAVFGEPPAPAKAIGPWFVSA